jgi:hypothetical protein
VAPAVPAGPMAPVTPVGPWAFHVISFVPDGHFNEPLIVTLDNVRDLAVTHAEYLTVGLLDAAPATAATLATRTRAPPTAPSRFHCFIFSPLLRPTHGSPRLYAKAIRHVSELPGLNPDDAYEARLPSRWPQDGMGVRENPQPVPFLVRVRTLAVPIVVRRSKHWPWH